MALHAPAYLHLSRHGIFYFRITIPAPLRTHFGAREVKRSLKTRHRRTAIQLARVCAMRIEGLFATLQENPVTYLERKQLLKDAKASILDDLTHRLDTDGPLNQAGRSEVVGEMKVLRTLVVNTDTSELDCISVLETTPKLGLFQVVSVVPFRKFPARRH